MLKKYLLFVLLAAPWLLPAQTKIQLVDFATGFTRPVDITHCGDSRLFVVEKAGYIRIVDTLGNKFPTPFLDITDRVLSTGNEQGLLGLAFSPNYAQNKYFYVYYTKKPSGDTRVSRFSRDSTDVNKADPNSEQIILEQTQPYANHNGGCIKFSPTDGYLYIGLGDGGSAGDPQSNGQKKNTFLAKILRIDVTPGPTPYTVPADNPFVNDPSYFPEIWSLGWRNPWRFSFDQLNGDLWVGDVGQNAHEEIDYQPAGQGGGNYGWRCYEGTYTYNTNGCPGASNFIKPIYDYANPSVGCSVTGGIIYRGSKYPNLYGVYLNADYCSGRWWATRHNANGTFTTTEIANLVDYEYSNLGEDYKGELYVSAHASGKIQKIKDLCAAFKVSAQVSDPVCQGSAAGFINLTYSGNVGAVTTVWSNGENTPSITGLNPGTYQVIAVDGNGCNLQDSFKIGIGGPAAPLLHITIGDTVLCAGQPLHIQATEAPSGMNYQWYKNGVAIDSSNTRTFIATESGLYTAVFSAATCTSPTSDPVSVRFVVQPQATATLTQGDTILCTGESVVLSASNILPGDAIQWFGPNGIIQGAHNAQFSASSPGAYHFTADGPCGTSISNSITLDGEFIILPFIYFVNDTLLAEAGYAQYQWSLNGQFIPGATHPVYVPLVSGNYSCNIVSVNGCSYTDLLSVEIVSATLPASVTKFSLSPNPSSGTINMTLELDKSQHIRFFLLDTAGREIFLQTQQTQRLNKPIELKELPKGAYFLHVELENGSFVRRVVKN
ncbi:MAG: PQQ-dependent sugar dehydrogenase [Bacteroidota bacterium]